MTAARRWLVGLASGDETCLSSAVSSIPGPGGPGVDGRPGLDRRLRSLVRLAAILAVDGSPASVCWAAELAATNGADDDDLAAVLLVVGPCAVATEAVSGAGRLVSALGYTEQLPPEPLPA